VSQLSICKHGRCTGYCLRCYDEQQAEITKLRTALERIDKACQEVVDEYHRSDGIRLSPYGIQDIARTALGEGGK
jgi:hypothetical protein